MVSDNPVRAERVATGRLWFGTVGSAVAWLSLGFLDLLIVWVECARQQQYQGETAHPHARTLSFVLAIILFITAVCAGTTSYRNWRAVAGDQRLLHTAATGRQEFMALIGVIVTITLGVGIIWLSLPPLLVQLCQRAK